VWFTLSFLRSKNVKQTFLRGRRRRLECPWIRKTPERVGWLPTALALPELFREQSLCGHRQGAWRRSRRAKEEGEAREEAKSQGFMWPGGNV
jgi:hypothetical protein